MVASTPVDQAHTIDDLTREVAALRRGATDARALLTDALAALRAGDVHVTDEFLDRALVRLDRAFNG